MTGKLVVEKKKKQIVQAPKKYESNKITNYASISLRKIKKFIHSTCFAKKNRLMNLMMDIQIFVCDNRHEISDCSILAIFFNGILERTSDMT